LYSAFQCAFHPSGTTGGGGPEGGLTILFVDCSCVVEGFGGPDVVDVTNVTVDENVTVDTTYVDNNNIFGF